MKPFVALVKAFRGGEWLDTVLRSVSAGVDGVVVVMSKQSWDKNGLENNCLDTVRTWQREHSDWLFTAEIESEKSSDQVRQGLAVIREKYGEDTAVMSLDTDEVWEPKCVDRLRVMVNEMPDVHYFCGRLYSYLRSPLYQVYPMERACPTVAIQCATDQDASNRFQRKYFGPVHVDDNIWFHHFTYVREDEREIAAKLKSTSTQETIASNPKWLDTVWPKLPMGTNLHMTYGHESCWGGIKILAEQPVSVPSFCQKIIADEDRRWRKCMEDTPPGQTLVPVPTPFDAEKYPEFKALAPDVSSLRTRLKMSYLEALTLYRIARALPRPANILEIGSGSGGSLACLALGSKGELWAVDPFTPYDETNTGPTVHGVREGNEEDFWLTAYAYGFRKRVTQIKLNSDVAAASCPNGMFDVCLVDGNHTYEIAANDIRLYWEKLKPGGLMLVHDHTQRFPGVVRAVKESGRDFAVYAGTSLAYCRKSL